MSIAENVAIYADFGRTIAEATKKPGAPQLASVHGSYATTP